MMRKFPSFKLVEMLVECLPLHSFSVWHSLLVVHFTGGSVSLSLGMLLGLLAQLVPSPGLVMRESARTCLGSGFPVWEPFPGIAEPWATEQCLSSHYCLICASTGCVLGVPN